MATVPAASGQPADRPTPRQRWWEAAADVVIGGAKIGATVVVSPIVRHRYNRHGATDAEVAGSMPGDELAPDPMLGFTRAITIDAPAEEVWSWLVQIGQGRGGLYSYDGLENLLGCDLHSADAIVAEYQQLAVGDLVRSGPDRYPCWMVMEIARPTHLVLLGAGSPAEVSVPEVVDEVPEEGYAASTWQWQLRPDATGRRTRLVVRQRLRFSPGQGWMWRLVEPINFVMGQKMLRGIKARAERASTAASGDAEPASVAAARWRAALARCLSATRTRAATVATALRRPRGHRRRRSPRH